MKVLRAEQIRAADQYTIANEPIYSIDLMERASQQCADWILNRFGKERFFIFCGRGNNGGDGLAIARMLLNAGRKVEVFLLSGNTAPSEDNRTNQERLTSAGGTIHLVHSANNLPEGGKNDVWIEALFGTGLTRPLEGLAKDVIDALNAMSSPRLAIDLPAGLLSDEEHNPLHSCFHADFTLSFQVPKLCFFLPSCAPALGCWTLLDIGLDPTFIAAQASPYAYLLPAEAARILRNRTAFSHKGSFGHSLIVAGSLGKIGAAVLATRAALRTGSGLVTCISPRCGYEILQVSAPEAMVLPSDGENFLDRIPSTDRFSAIALGPGIGQEKETQRALLEFLHCTEKALVLDADALNILASQSDWPSLLPKRCILTPHPGEFDRLFGAHTSTLERLHTQRHFAQTQQCCVILKGRYTSIALPDGQVIFNSSGNPGMATGGSGDVLSGILVALLAQSYSLEESAMLGVFLHGLAGDLAKDQFGEEALIASDIIEHLGAAFQKMRNPY